MQNATHLLSQQLNSEKRRHERADKAIKQIERKLVELKEERDVLKARAEEIEKELKQIREASKFSNSVKRKINW